MASSYAPDDGFREIQLNGKQLFFLFMATTIVSVVIFLCGVLVGRGVRGERTALADATVEQAPTSDIAPAAAPAQSAASDPIAAAAPPPPTADDEPRPALVAITAAPDTKADPVKPIAAPAAAPTPAVPPVKAEASPAPKPASPTKPAKEDVKASAAVVSAGPGAEPGFVVQVAAVKTRGEADTLVKKVTANGYQAYISESIAGTFRVRVGPYKVRRDAETAADKLKRQQLAPDTWVTAQ